MPLAKPMRGLQALRNEGLATLKKLALFINADRSFGRCQVSVEQDLTASASWRTGSVKPKPKKRISNVKYPM